MFTCMRFLAALLVVVGHGCLRIRAMARRHVLFFTLPLGLLMAVVASPAASAASRLASAQIIEQAVLRSQSGERTVPLPHALEATDFVAEGSTVQYRFSVNLTEVPANQMAVFIPKISLSGRIYLNGQFLDACAIGDLKLLRCLHQPNFFQVPAGLWRAGVNVFDVEVYANHRQTNGLSAVWVGDAKSLYEQAYRWRQLFAVDIIMGLAWTSVSLGLLSLLVWAILRTEPAFLWFGIASIIHALSLLNHLVTKPSVSIEFFTWLAFASRIAASPMAVLTLLAIFNKLQRRYVVLFVGYTVLATLLLWFSDTSRVLAVALFTPTLILAPVLLGQSVRWAYQERNLMRVVGIGMTLIMYGAGLWDWIRLTGQTRFDGGYFFPYTYSGMLMLLGILLFPNLATALRQTRRDHAELQRRSAERMAYEVTENIPVGTFTLVHRHNMPVGQLLFVSQRFVQITGLALKSLPIDGRVLLACTHPDDRERLRPLLEQGEPHHVRISLRLLREQALRWVSLEAVPRLLQDGSLLYEGVLVDETESVLARQEAEKTRAQLQQQQIEQLRVKEREQLLRDMHDGFGSQIASVRMMAEKGKIQPEEFTRFLQEIASDLHLVVDTLGQLDITLEDALVDMQYRLARRFGVAGMPALQWRVALEGLPHLPSRTILQILRLIQEALNNALKHAHASHIRIEVLYQKPSGDLVVSVTDNGKGMAGVPGRGRGINNMKHRAREIGAVFAMDNQSPSGVRVSLRIPPEGLALAERPPAQSSL